jgi:ligand-binding SRPBCC domain-containing protein
MKIYSLNRAINIPVTELEAWSFFSNPHNLSVITPKSMNFEVLKVDSDKIYDGQRIQYKVSPLFGINLNWTSLISDVVEQKCFTDIQINGPYKYWHHKHIFKKISGGVKIMDKIQYSLPFGLIGSIFHPILVKNKLEHIFRYRNLKIKEIFGEIK